MLDVKRLAKERRRNSDGCVKAKEISERMVLMHLGQDEEDLDGGRVLRATLSKTGEY